LFEEKTVPVMAYTLETILAEKYETIIRRNIGTTRARDFYDLHTLFRVRRDTVRVSILKEAVIHTARKRGSLDDLQDWKEIVQDIRSEPALQQLWTNYIQDNRFASQLTFSEVVDTVETIGNLLGIGATE
jgi:predicted nucleotidyltransferase component of viral defense system